MMIALGQEPVILDAANVDNAPTLKSVTQQLRRIVDRIDPCLAALRPSLPPDFAAALDDLSVLVWCLNMARPKEERDAVKAIMDQPDTHAAQDAKPFAPSKFISLDINGSPDDIPILIDDGQDDPEAPESLSE